MNNQVCLITGGTSGIGEEAAVQLARLGATVIITGRDRARGEAVLERIDADSKARAQSGQKDFAALKSARPASSSPARKVTRSGSDVAGTRSPVIRVTVSADRSWTPMPVPLSV